VRGAIDFVLIEHALRELTGRHALTAGHLARVAELALSSKIVPDEPWGRSAEDLARELTLGAARSLAVLA
jgi:hypothetical protein